MFGWGKRKRREAQIATLHAAVVEASRDPILFGDDGLPDTVEGRFESLVLHAMLALRRLRQLPEPAGDVGQDLVDSLFAHLEIALRESGVGDMGVPKRMKKLGRAFYDRLSIYEPALEGGAEPLADALASRLAVEPGRLLGPAGIVVAAEGELAGADLAGFLTGEALAGLHGGAVPA